MLSDQLATPGPVTTQPVTAQPLASHPFVTPPGEGQALWHLAGAMHVKATAASTGGVLGAFEQTLPAGPGAPLHVHDGEDEAWYVLDGEVAVVVDGRWFEASAGSFVWAPRGLAHSFHVASPTARLLALVTPGGFEDFFVASGRPAAAMGLPPAPDGPPDLELLVREAARRGCRILGPAPEPPATDPPRPE
jgi:quercetin dioxygenase-like cupin family protein